MATPPVAEMMEDLRAADAAGDTKLAQHIAGLIKAKEGGKSQPARPEDDSFLGRLKEVGRGLLPPKESPLGALLSMASDKYRDTANQYGGLYQPPLPDKTPGESGADYLGRLQADPASQGIGMAIAGYGVGGAPKIGAVRPTATATTGLRGFANRLAASALKGTAGEYKALGPEDAAALGQWLLENKAVPMAGNAASIAKRASPLMDQAVTNLDASLGKLDATGSPGLDKIALRDALLDAAVKAEGKGPAAAPIVSKFMDAAGDVDTRLAQPGASPTGTFTEGELWKRGYQDIAYPKGRAPIDPTPQQVADQHIASIARQQIEDAAEKAAAGGPDFQAFLKAKRDYGAAATAKRMLEGAEGRASARNLASPSDKGVAGLGLLMTGEPLTALGMGAANNLIRTRAASAGARTLDWMDAALGKPSQATGAQAAGAAGAPFRMGLPRVPADSPQPTDQESPAGGTGAPRDSSPAGVIGEALRGNPQAFGRFSTPLQKAAAKGDGSLGAAHFLLYQNEPEYQRAYDSLQKGQR